MVGVTGFEPATSPSRTVRATRLRHTPILQIILLGFTKSNYLIIQSDTHILISYVICIIIVRCFRFLIHFLHL